MAADKYSNRKFDIMISEDYQGKCIFNFSNKIVTGIQKAVQMFIVKLFTALQSYIFDDNCGTVFGQQLKSGIINTYPGAVFHLFSLAISDVIEQLAQDPSSFSDENITSATIEKYEEKNGELNITINVSTESGTSYSFLLPLTAM